MKRAGFTIIELLIVIVIIAVLAAIVLVNYASWQQKVATAEVKSDLMSAAAAMESAKNFSTTGYPTTQSGLLAVYTPNDKDVTLTLQSGSTSTNYCIQGSSVKFSSIVYYVTPSSARLPGTSC
jgi:prepilin-type N-terminal cleavage/methylation domain-containing protein